MNVSSNGNAKLDRRLRLAALLIGLGLVVEALTMKWAHPTAFLAFVFPGIALVAAGTLLYLYAIVSA